MMAAMVSRKLLISLVGAVGEHSLKSHDLYLPNNFVGMDPTRRPLRRAVEQAVTVVNVRDQLERHGGVGDLVVLAVTVAVAVVAVFLASACVVDEWDAVARQGGGANPVAELAKVAGPEIDIQMH